MEDGISCTCGAKLVDEVTATGVRPRGAEEAIVFRRTTDHVICDACFSSYDVRALISLATGEEERTKLLSLVERLD